MACGVTKSTPFGTATCDNAGTSSHTGLHSAVLATFRGYPSIRVTWHAPDATVARQKAIVVGDKTP